MPVIIKWQALVCAIVISFPLQSFADEDTKIISKLIFPLSDKLLGRKQYTRLKYDSNNNRFKSEYEIKPLGAVNKDSIAGKIH